MSAGSRRVRTNHRSCEIPPASIPHGGRTTTVSRRGVDAGEREEPLKPTRRGAFEGTGPEQAGPHAGSLNGAKPMTCGPRCAGGRPAPARDAGSAKLLSTGSATSGDVKPRGVSPGASSNWRPRATASQAVYTVLIAKACPLSRTAAARSARACAHRCRARRAGTPPRRHCAGRSPPESAQEIRATRP